MSKTFRPYAPRQSFLLPPSPLEWLPQDHLALFILDIVQQLDLSPIYAHYERELRGYPPLSANVSETARPLKFTEQGEQGSPP